MTADLTGWEREPCDGGIVLRAPSRRMRIRVRPRLRPMTKLRELLDVVIAEATELGGSPPTIERGPVVRFVTAEGEHAGVTGARLGGTGRSLEVAVAIAGDEPYMCIDAIGIEATTETVRALIERLGTGLGALRRRPFLYDLPLRWLGLRRHASTVWLHPGYPRTASRITVFDARPFVSTEAQRLERLVFMRAPGELTASAVAPPEELVMTCGLVARVWTTVGKLEGDAAVLRCAAVTADDRFLYAARFDGHRGTTDLETFRHVFASLRPIPAARIDGALTWASE